jgi:glycosyltransferase involved in cell wall biosynthesis
MLCIRSKKTAVTEYRMTKPLKDVAKFRKTLLRKNDKVTIQKLAERLKKIDSTWNIKYLKDFHTANVLISMRNAVGAKIVMDIDDNIWNVPLGNIARSKDGWDKFVALNTGLVQEVDWLTVSTEPLKTILEPLNPKIVVLPNIVNPDEWRFERKKHDKLRIGWVWSPTHIPDIPVVEEALRKIYKKYDVEIVIFGRENNLFDFPTTNIKGVKHSEYPKLFREAGIDISICPLKDNDFNRCKSNIKWLESTLAGAAVVASDVHPYSSSIKDGKTGYIAKGTNQWVKKLSWLIESKEKRDEMVKNARKEVLDNYTSNKKWLQFYESIK